MIHENMLKIWEGTAQNVLETTTFDPNSEVKYLLSVAIPSLCLVVREMQKLQVQNEQLRADHTEMVRRNKLLRDRTDLPIERLKAYDDFMNDLQKLRDEIQKLKSSVCSKYSSYTNDEKAK